MTIDGDVTDTEVVAQAKIGDRIGAARPVASNVNLEH
jgi:hypothetical protein